MWRSWAVFLPCSLLLWLLVAQTNYYLAQCHLYVYAGGLFVAYPSLRLPNRQGLGLALLAGLLYDTCLPVPFGTHLLLFAFAHALIFKLQDRISGNQPIPQLFIALVANASLYLLIAILMGVHLPFTATMLPRQLADLFVSELFVAIVGIWFLALQNRVFHLARIAPRTRF